MTAIREGTARAFDRGFGGATTVEGDAGYDAARAVWNGVIDCRPELIAHCRSVADVVAAVGLTREAGRLSCRAGWRAQSGGLLDL